MRPKVAALIVGCLLVCSAALQATDNTTGRSRTDGTGFVTDGSHPNHPGDFRTYDLGIGISFDQSVGEADLEFSWEENGKRLADHYYFRRGRLFQVDDSAREKSIDPLGDISAATIAALHPMLVQTALEERSYAIRPISDASVLFAWNNALWTVSIDTKSSLITKLTRRTYHDLYGDGEEQIRYIRNGKGDENIDTVVVTSYGRETARFSFGDDRPDSTLTVPAGDAKLDASLVIKDVEISFTELAPHIFAIDLQSLNSRVTVAEFSDHLMVIEGAYNSRVCDRLAQAIAARFNKPVRYFAFSHLHGQYVGGVRTWIAAGSTVLVPPSTKPMIEEIAQSMHTLRPDNLTRKPTRLMVETIAKDQTYSDDLNAISIYNVVSDHTDDYFIFYFPQQKVLLTGDLLFYREGKPLAGRSKKLCETVAILGLDVETYCATWPLTGYGTKNIVTRAEMNMACGQ